MYRLHIICICIYMYRKNVLSYQLNNEQSVTTKYVFEAQLCLDL